VPDWYHWSFRSLRSRPGLEVTDIPENTFSASGFSKPSIAFHGTYDRILRIAGLYFDTISNVSSVNDPLITQVLFKDESGFIGTSVFNRSKPYEELQRRYTILQGLLPETVSSENERMDSSALRTLLRDMELDPNTSETAEINRAQYYSRDKTHWKRLRPDRLYDISKNFTEAAKDDNYSSIPWQNLLLQSDEKRPFVTAKGHLGLGPAGLQEDDLIVVILGAEVPFILRETRPGEYILIGEAYVDGIMDGEVMEKLESIRHFDIC
jgi:hypothetical protein